MTDILAFPPELLTKKLCAHMLSTSEWGVTQLIKENKLTAVDDGGKWTKVRLTDLRYYIEHLPEKSQ